MSDNDQKDPMRKAFTPGRGTQHAAQGATRAVPGKQTLVQQLYDEMPESGVGKQSLIEPTFDSSRAPREIASGAIASGGDQETADARAKSPDSQQAAAAQGIATPSLPLPHADRIQASFGAEHDVSGIHAHIDPGSTHSMGAEAYAVGHHVVFASVPSVDEAAHEAAHVVQQAQGVNLTGGVGDAGDEYERSADAVADRVKAGQSATDLLGPGTKVDSRTSLALQKKSIGGGDSGHDSAVGDAAHATRSKEPAARW